MDSYTLCFALVLLCAGMLLMFPSAVVPMPTVFPPFPFRLYSRATGRYMVLQEGQPIHAGGADSDDSTIVCVTYKSLAPPVLVTIHSCQDPSIFLAIDSNTGHIQAKKMVEGEDHDDVITFELVIPEGSTGFSQQLVARVTLQQPCPKDGDNADAQLVQQGSGNGGTILEEPSETKLCPVTKQCYLAFDGITEQVIHCPDQENLSPKSNSKTLSLTPPRT